MPRDLIAGTRTGWDARGTGPSCLFVHCQLGRRSMWDDVCDRMGKRRLVRFDLPGHGESDDWDGTRDFHDQSLEITRALAETSGGPIDLVGHSFGATVGLRLAQETPGLIRSLILIEPVLFAVLRSRNARILSRLSAAEAEFRAALEAGDTLAAARAFTGIWGTGVAFDDLPEQTQRYAADRMHLVQATDTAVWDDVHGLLSGDGLAGLRCPVLLVEGANSPPVIHAIQDALSGEIPNAKRVVIPGAGHMLPVTHAAALASEIVRFLDEVNLDRTG